MTTTSLATPTPAAIRHVEDLGSFIAASPSPFHAVAEAARRLTGAGFGELLESEPWTDVSAGRYVIRDGAIVAWYLPPAAGAATPLRVFGAHTDSPALTLKPHPTTSAFGWLQAGVELYGGGLLNSWLDREIELAGRLVTRDGRVHLTRTGPLLRIPQLAPHLDRSVNEALHLDRQRHMNPIWGLGELGDADLLTILARAAHLEVDDVAGFDIVGVDAQGSRRFGLDGQLFASPRLDNLLSVHAGMSALLAHASNPPAAGPIAVLAAFDHEEVGSQSRSGADGSFLQDVLVRLGRSIGADDDARLAAWSSSLCVSSDVGHSINPNYPEKHDPVVRPLAGHGPMLKINANQRYVTDGVGAAAWRAACERADVPCQEFVSNNSSPCGSTIGPMTAARLGIRTLDVGAPILSMHSAREMCATVDPEYLARAATAFFAM